MIKLKRFLAVSLLITIICLILVLIPATFLPFGQSTVIIYDNPWFKWVFGFLFFSLTLGCIIVCLLLREVKSVLVHLGVLLILVGGLLSSSSTQGRAAINEGESFQSFYDVEKEMRSFPSSITLLKFNEQKLSNTVEIAGKEYEFSPSHPLEKWGYFFYTYDYDLNWHISKVIVADRNNNEYLFEPTNRRHFVNPYYVKFVGLVVNDNRDTLSEFIFFKSDTLIGAVFVGRYGTLEPSYGMDLRLVRSDFDVSYISTILIKKDQGLYYAFAGFAFCLIGLAIFSPEKRWIS